MTMLGAQLWLQLGAALAVLTGLGFLVARLLRAYLDFRGTRVITCPATLRPAAVELDARLAVWSGVIGDPAFRIAGCTRWPEHRSCGQDCLRQVEHAPTACLARTILTSWYEGRSCALCGRRFGEISSFDHKPAVMDANRITREWGEIAAERLPNVLATSFPVCWSCHIAETFRRVHPELVVERPWRGHEGASSSCAR